MAHKCKACQLTTVKESQVGDVTKGRRDIHFCESVAEHKGFFANVPPSGWKPDVLKTHAM